METSGKINFVENNKRTAKGMSEIIFDGNAEEISEGIAGEIFEGVDDVNSWKKF